MSSDLRTRLLVQANFLTDANGEVDEATLRQDLIDGADELTRLQSELDEAVDLVQVALNSYEDEHGKITDPDDPHWSKEARDFLHRINSRGEQ